ncbi:unnamed protein product [Aphanomyces euteiches]
MVVWCTKHQRGPKATREYPKHTPQDVSPLVFSRLMTHLPRADLDPIFLGYASQRKSYRLQDCESGRTPSFLAMQVSARVIDFKIVNLDGLLSVDQSNSSKMAPPTKTPTSLFKLTILTPNHQDLK